MFISNMKAADQKNRSVYESIRSRLSSRLGPVLFLGGIIFKTMLNVKLR